MQRCQRPPIGLSGVSMIMLIFGIIVVLSLSVMANVAPDGAAMVGDETCLGCHDDYGDSWKSTVHGAAGAVTGDIRCESCHGPGSVHVEDQDPEMIFNPAKASQFDENSSCLGCHNTDVFDEWSFSHHNNADVNCASCHNIHAESKLRNADEVQELCFNCHGDVRASMFMPSRHPIREGKVTCLDCHNVHGGAVALTQENTIRELCFSCHPEKEGPFVFEHVPVNEDCMTCHTPHGSVVDNLLTQTEPTLCLNCHAMHFHATLEGWTVNGEAESEFTPPHGPGRTSLSTHDGWKQGMLTKCTQCHSAIHGTDLPSQAITTGGQGLTR